MDDLQAVALAYRDRAILRARHDLQIALDGDLHRVEPQPCQQVAYAERAAELAPFAVDRHTDGR